MLFIFKTFLYCLSKRVLGMYMFLLICNPKNLNYKSYKAEICNVYPWLHQLVAWGRLWILWGTSRQLQVLSSTFRYFQPKAIFLVSISGWSYFFLHQTGAVPGINIDHINNLHNWVNISRCKRDPRPCNSVGALICVLS